MDYSDQRNVRLDERETDRVSQWLLRVAISMIVLGTVFALLDWYDLLPLLPAAGIVHAILFAPAHGVITTAAGRLFSKAYLRYRI